MCIFVPRDEIPGGTFMKKFCIAALAATLALGTMITAQAADTIDVHLQPDLRKIILLLQSGRTPAR